MEHLPDNGFTELWLHYIWRESKLEGIRLRTVDDRELSVVFPGWYNRSWGPDFSEARILIDGQEFFGDVEIHVTESSWSRHKHDQDPAYNKVILHVFFRQDGRPAINQFRRKLPALNLGNPAFEAFWVRYDIRRPVMMRELPGACGLCLTADRYRRLKDLIFQAAEQRLLNKAEGLRDEMETVDVVQQEDLLFRKICQSAGYAAYAGLFAELARKYPYSHTTSLFRAMHRQNRVEILGRWLGFMGFLDTINAASVHDSLRREWLALQQFWTTLRDTPSAAMPLSGKPSRPLNHPLRRLYGLYYHIEHVQFQGLFKSWLRFILDCRQLMKRGKRQSTSVLTRLEEMFPQPAWEPLNDLMSVTSERISARPARLIGRQRQRIILINAIIPFFLSWSRINQDRDLEKTLFDLFLILPTEAKNRKTRFLEQRLFLLHPEFKMKKNLSYHQGLIQLHDDCCKSYYEGCLNCTLVKLLQKTETV